MVRVWFRVRVRQTACSSGKRAGSHTDGALPCFAACVAYLQHKSRTAILVNLVHNDLSA
jgi:hypothetical protein